MAEDAAVAEEPELPELTDEELEKKIDRDIELFRKALKRFGPG